MKAFAARISMHGTASIVFEDTAGKARYATYLSANDAGFDCKIVDITVHRAKQFDGAMDGNKEPEPGKCYGAEYLTKRKETA